MNHLFIIVHFASFITGFGLMALVSFFYNRYGNKGAKYVFWGDIFYTFVLLIDTLDLYFRKNIVHYPPIIHEGFKILLVIGGISGLYFLLLITHNITGTVLSRRKVLAFRILSVLIFAAVFVPELLHVSSIIKANISGGFIFLSLNIVLLYNLFLIIFKMDSIQKQLRPLVLSCVILIAASTIYSLLTNIFSGLPAFIYKVPVSPIVYFFMNASGIVYIKKYLFTAGNENPSLKDEESSIRPYDYGKLAVLYNITERELEIVRLVVDGLNNKDIGEKLFISPNTVKNHIYNIYRKIGIKNRFELMSLLAKTGSSHTP